MFSSSVWLCPGYGCNRWGPSASSRLPTRTPGNVMVALYHGPLVVITSRPSETDCSRARVTCGARVNAIKGLLTGSAPTPRVGNANGRHGHFPPSWLPPSPSAFSRERIDRVLPTIAAWPVASHAAAIFFARSSGSVGWVSKARLKHKPDGRRHRAVNATALHVRPKQSANERTLLPHII